MPRTLSWAPAIVLATGAVLTIGGGGQQQLELRQPLDVAIPVAIAEYGSRDLEISEAELRVTGVSSYLLREYVADVNDDTASALLYVGYYDHQTQGRTIHSPKNCLPGSGWEALASQRIAIPAGDEGSVDVNRYLLRRGKQRALVLYWYQGRGRVAADEYRVKWDLFRDAALRRRSEEALVRIVVPIDERGEDPAFETAVSVARTILPSLTAALPG